jgi:hypothetical protein
VDFVLYYNLESYLLDTVRPRFHDQRRLSAFDFFSIVIWKANRAKSRVAKRLLAKGAADLDVAVSQLTSDLAQQPTDKDRLRYLLGDWGLRLPMASAILAILYPDDFTVYDYRICDQLRAFHDLADRSKFEDVWHCYEAYRSRVRDIAPAGLSLRDKDRYLWGKSAYDQLVVDVERKFGINEVTGSEPGSGTPQLG